MSGSGDIFFLLSLLEEKRDLIFWSVREEEKEILFCWEKKKKKNYWGGGRLISLSGEDFEKINYN